MSWELLYKYRQNQPMTICHLERLELIDFIVNETDRETQGDFDLEMLYEQLDVATDEEVQAMAETFGWC